MFKNIDKKNGFLHLRQDWMKLFKQQKGRVHVVESSGLQDILDHYNYPFNNKQSTVKGAMVHPSTTLHWT